MKRPFLVWALINSLFAVAVVAGALSYDGEVHAAGKTAVFVVLGVYALASARAGGLAWREAPDRSGFVSLAVRLCPMIAMLGTVGGFLVAFGGEAEDVQRRVLGASTGLVATLVGISCAAVLMLQQHWCAREN